MDCKEVMEKYKKAEIAMKERRAEEEVRSYAKTMISELRSKNVTDDQMALFVEEVNRIIVKFVATSKEIQSVKHRILNTNG